MKTEVAIVKCPNYNIDEVIDKTRVIFSYFTGIKTILKKNPFVLLKPNLLIASSPEQAIITHPTLIEAIIKILKEIGVSSDHIHLGDSPGFGTANGVAESCGIKDICFQHGVKLIEFNKPKWIKTDIKGYRKISIASQAFEYDIIINIAKLKAHCQILLTAGVKNMFGFCVGKTKTYMHLKSGNNLNNFAKMIVKNYSLISPTFTIVDAIYAMEGTGPTTGHPNNLGLLIAGKDAVAVDRVIAKIISLSPDKIPVLKAAKELNVGETDLDKIEIFGDKLNEIETKDFKLDFELTDIGFNVLKFIKSNIKSLFARIKEIFG